MMWFSMVTICVSLVSKWKLNIKLEQQDYYNNKRFYYKIRLLGTKYLVAKNLFLVAIFYYQIFW